MASKLRIKVNALEVAHLLALAFIAAMFAAANAHAAGSALCVVSNQRTGIRAGSLQEAVNAAAAGDTLLVRGICSGPSTIDKSLRVEGGTLDGGGLGSVITVAAGANVSIARLVITNGVGAFGGGINNSGTLTVDSTVITGNVATAGTGGGIFNTGTLTLSRSVVSGNRGGNGGGISVNFGGSATLNGSTVSGNSAFAGGGISSNNAADRIVLNDSTVRNNDATALGGGILVGQGAVLTAARSAVIGNHAPNGGGVSSSGAASPTSETRWSAETPVLPEPASTSSPAPPPLPTPP